MRQTQYHRFECIVLSTPKDEHLRVPNKLLFYLLFLDFTLVPIFSKGQLLTYDDEMLI